WLGDNSLDPDGWASWAVLLLPYLEQDNVYRLWEVRNIASSQPTAAYQTQLTVLHCPTRPAFVLSGNDFAPAGLSDYACCFGTDADGANSNGAIIPVKNPQFTSTTQLAPTSPRGQFPLTGIIDGSSNTLMFGEKHVRPNSMRGKNEDRSVFGGQN